MGKQYISWRRVSTFKQNRSGLGLEAQKEIIRYFIERDKGDWVADYEECYTGTELSGCEELRKAMNHAKNIGATLIIAKTDRFRNTAEALKIYEEMGDGHLMFCDLPSSDKFSLTLFFALAEREALIVSIRTKQALAVKKANGCKLGAANEKFQANRANKDKEVLLNQYNKMGNTKRTRFQESKRTQAFLRILQQIFPDATTNEDPHKWEWKLINTKGDNKDNILKMMKTMRDLDDSGHLWHKWDFDADERLQQQRLAAQMHSIKRTFMS
jgi:DNA invertase Pin-like site-specific DNA recombinase